MAWYSVAQRQLYIRIYKKNKNKNSGKKRYKFLKKKKTKYKINLLFSFFRIQRMYINIYFIIVKMHIYYTYTELIK